MRPTVVKGHTVRISPPSFVVLSILVKLAISLALQVFISRELLPEGRGIYAVCIASSTFLLVVTFFGNEFGIRHLLVQKKITPSQAVLYLCVVSFFSFIAALLIAFGLYVFHFWIFERITLLQSLLALILVFSQLISTQINVFLTIQRKYMAASLVGIGEEFAKLLVLLILFMQIPSVETALVATSIGSILTSVFCVVRFRFLVKDFSGVHLKEVRYILIYGLQSVWLNLSNLSNAQLGTLILSGLMSNERVGLYNLAFGLVARVQVLPDALNRVLVPASIGSDDETRAKMVRLSATALLLFCFAIVPLLGLWNEQIMSYAFGVEYAEAGPVAFVLFLGFMFKVICKPIEAYFNEITGNPMIIAVSQIFSVAAMTVATFLGATTGGLIGASAGSAIALVLSAAILLVVYARFTNQKLHKLLDFGALHERVRRSM